MKALVLGGGGSKCSAQLGCIRYLLDTENVDYDIYTGISGGALNASILSTGPLRETLPKLEKIWLEDIKGNHSVWTHHLWWYIISGISLIIFFVILALISFLFDFNKLITILFILLSLTSLYVPYYSLKNTKSIYKTESLRDLITKNLDIDKLKNSNKKLSIGSICYETGEYKNVNGDNDKIIDWIMASSAFPLFFPMVEIDGKHWTDPGIVNVATLYDAIALGATEIDIIICNSLNPGEQNKLGLPRQFERTLDLMSAEILGNDLIICKSYANIRIFMPSKSLGNTSLNFDPEKIKKMFDIGIEMGIAPVILPARFSSIPLSK